MSLVPLAIRSSSGINIIDGPPSFKENKDFQKIESKQCRSILFNRTGEYLAVLNSSQLCVFKTDEWKNIFSVSTRAQFISFSPKGTYLTTWEPFRANSENSPNLFIFKTETGELVRSIIKKQNWEIQFSFDEIVCSQLEKNHILFYENVNFDKVTARLNCFKVKSYSMSPNVGTHFIIGHTLGQPACGKLFKYPNFQEKDVMVSRSFFQADTMKVFWNSKGNNALLLTSTDTDKTGGSYYGKQGLYFISITGNTLMVTMSKEGPIYSVEWSPNNEEFCVVYGYTPPKSTVFNLKCEPIYELGTGPYNSIYYNPQGSIILLGGFGNMNGDIEVWERANWKKLATCKASDTTLLQWAPDGTHFFTATTSPRLRVGNGYKIWHFSGSLLHEKSMAEKEELYELLWKTYPKRSFKEPNTSEKVQGIVSAKPEASRQGYVPPHLRNRPAKPSLKIHEEYEQAHKPGASASTTPSKAALKNKKKREAKKSKKDDEGDVKESTFVSSLHIELTGDAEKDKKLKNIKKKLDAIEKLKLQQAEGKVLDVNQVTKIKGKSSIRWLVSS